MLRKDSKTLKIFWTLIVRILGTFLIVGAITYSGWWFLAQHSSRSVFDTGILGIAAVYISSFLFWGALPKNQSDPISKMAIEVSDGKVAIHKIKHMLQQYGFDVDIFADKVDKMEALGKWWLFSERIEVVTEPRCDNKDLLRINFYMKYLNSFFTIPMFPFYPSIFTVTRITILQSKIQSINYLDRS